MHYIANNKISVPPFIYGTAWKKRETASLVQLAVAAGFKAIDTANQLIHYEEALVGEALLAIFKRGIHRDSLFLQTKFTPVSGQDHRTPYNPDDDLAAQVSQSVESSLQHLHTDYLDSYLLHGPYSRSGLSQEDWEVWSAIEGIHQSGKTRVIGVSNVNARQLLLLCEQAAIKPMIVQNRCYARLGWDRQVREICQANGIIYQGFSLLTANREVLLHPSVRSMAEKLGVGSAQIIFRFAMQSGILPLTGTTNADHMKEDLRVLDLEISEEDVRYIETMAVQ